MEATKPLLGPVSQDVTSKRIEVLSLGVAFVKEIRLLALSTSEVQGLLNLIQNLLQKEGFLNENQ